MALSIDYNQTSLHRCSKEAFNRQLAQKDLQHTFKQARSSSDNPKIPDPGLFNFHIDASAEDRQRRLPTAAECATHLELLQAFRHIRTQIESSTRLDRVFGIKPEPRIVYRKRRVYKGRKSSWVREEVKLRDNNFEKRREVKWPLYLKLAAARFLSWAAVVEEVFFSQPPTPSQSLRVPPLDILMVWHAFLLNPKWFQSFKQSKLKYLSTVPFPWDQIHAAIDSNSRDWPFELSKEDQDWFQEKTGSHPDLLGFLIKANKSSIVRNCLAIHGIKSRHLNGSRGLRLKDIPKVYIGNSNLELAEVKFLDSCRLALGSNDTVKSLVEAVERQSAFVDKMEKQLWIRSPAVAGTLSRAIIRYERFLKLFKLYPKKMLVPTLDIDLVWHTHQCSPTQYGLIVTEIAGRFIDHNDKLGTITLNPAFENTKALYRIRFAEEYETCLCWDCEALRSTIASEDSNSQTDVASIAHEANSKVAYYRAVEIARQKGKELLPVYSLSEGDEYI
ncbi:hypothetical protein O1611_g2791 [Lasiodiplodia mahajangana]|uniref:Uncharacterized protein n=1 Tax=Lasiodiplodia mahajangana TaxID=1108764 RepID=A0ACC2JTM5_9PEZI|nr:hypothetical protein O1611_g2791 [Lasiodiplodia mahajangana]